MAAVKIALFLALLLVAAVAAESERDHDGGSAEEAKYEFQWQVSEDSNEFGHQEQRDGDDTKGSYYVQLPDGRRQTVTYYVDGDSGYVADVKYSGEAHFDEAESGERK